MFSFFENNSYFCIAINDRLLIHIPFLNTCFGGGDIRKII